MKTFRFAYKRLAAEMESAMVRRRMGNNLRSCLVGTLAFCALCFVGCHAEPPRFRMNLQDPERQKLPREQLLEASNALDGLFGDPDRPYIPPQVTKWLDLTAIIKASGPTGRKFHVIMDTKGVVYSGELVGETTTSYSLRETRPGAGVMQFLTPNAVKELSGQDGKSKPNLDQQLVAAMKAPQLGLYREHCVHCHGISGDGRGPTAEYLNPYPRDYRKGVYKFTSTHDGQFATREDIRRTLLEGIPGTAMPSFKLLPPDQVDALVEYVLYLSIRGQIEDEVLRAATGNYNSEDKKIYKMQDPTNREFQEEILDSLEAYVTRWMNAEEQVIVPSVRPPVDTPEQLALSIEKGRRLFLGNRANCYTCHGPNAMGDGWDRPGRWTGHGGDFFALSNNLDDWNKPKVDAIGKIVEHASIFDLPGQQVPPRNLRLGIYRGGLRPVDLYRRIYAGVKGNNMPGAGKKPGASTAPMTDEEIWHVVDYIRSLPYEAESSTGFRPASLPSKGRL